MEDLLANKINLTDCPDEILLNIFVNLNDTSLLNAVQVCHRFKSIAKEAFSKLYNGSTKHKYFQLNICNENLMEERRQYKPFFSNFGENIGGISINFKSLKSGAAKVPKHHWLIVLIQRHCMSITSIRIENGEKIDLANIICFTPNLTHLYLKSLKLRNENWTKNNYPKLISFSAYSVKGINRDSFATFIMHNRQHLEKISLNDSVVRVNDIIYHLHDTPIKSVKLTGDTLEGGTFTEKTSEIKIANLKRLLVETNKDTFVGILSKIQGGCKNIETLSIQNVLDQYDNGGAMSMQHVTLVCGFNNLKTLNLIDFAISLNELQVLVREIPTLDYISFECAENFGCTQEDFLTIASLCRKLSQIDLVKEFDFDLPTLTYGFCSQFARSIGQTSNLRLEFWSVPYTIIVTRDEVRISEELDDEDKSHRIIFWEGYDYALSSTGKNLLELDAKVLLDVIGFLDGNALSAFFRTCRLTQQLVKEHLLQNTLFLSVDPMEEISEHSIAILGKHISRIVIEPNSIASELKKKKLMQDVAKYCGRNLLEFEMKLDKFPSEFHTEIRWPNLQKLRLCSTSIINNQTLRMFYCPMMTDLEIQCYGKNEIEFGVDWDVSFRNVTSLKFGFYNKSVEKFLFGINQRIGDQLKTLSLMGTSEWFRLNTCLCWINLNFMISRFRRLEKLHLHLKGIEDSNYKFMFENCTKLVELSILFHDDDEQYASLLDMFRLIKTNCKDVQTVNLVSKPSSFDESFQRQLVSLLQKVKVNFVDVDEEYF